MEPTNQYEDEEKVCYEKTMKKDALMRYEAFTLHYIYLSISVEEYTIPFSQPTLGKWHHQPPLPPCFP